MYSQRNAVVRTLLTWRRLHSPTAIKVLWPHLSRLQHSPGGERDAVLRGRHLHARLLDAEALRVVDVELAKLREGARVDGGGEGVRTSPSK